VGWFCITAPVVKWCTSSWVWEHLELLGKKPTTMLKEYWFSGARIILQ